MGWNVCTVHNKTKAAARDNEWMRRKKGGGAGRIIMTICVGGEEAFTRLHVVLLLLFLKAHTGGAGEGVASQSCECGIGPHAQANYRRKQRRKCSEMATHFHFWETSL